MSENLKNHLKDFRENKPEQKFKTGDLVDTKDGRRMVVERHISWLKEPEGWMNQYVCCPTLRDGKTADKRKWRTRANDIHNSISENRLTLVKAFNKNEQEEN
jgi:aromatic ring hydroxylase